MTMTSNMKGSRSAADFLGIDYSLLKELNKSHNYFEYFEEKKNEHI